MAIGNITVASARDTARVEVVNADGTTSIKTLYALDLEPSAVLGVFAGSANTIAQNLNAVWAGILPLQGNVKGYVPRDLEDGLSGTLDGQTVTDIPAAANWSAVGGVEKFNHEINLKLACVALSAGN